MTVSHMRDNQVSFVPNKVIAHCTNVQVRLEYRGSVNGVSLIYDNVLEPPQHPEHPPNGPAWQPEHVNLGHGNGDNLRFNHAAAQAQAQ